MCLLTLCSSSMREQCLTRNNVCVTHLPSEPVPVYLHSFPLRGLCNSWCILCRGGAGVHHHHHHLPRHRLDPRRARAFRTHLFRGSTLSWPLLHRGHQCNLVPHAPRPLTNCGPHSSAPNFLGRCGTGRFGTKALSVSSRSISLIMSSRRTS
jgi:hypothetical protein